MKPTIITLTTAALILVSPAVFAQGSSSKAPGQEMQNKGSVTGSPGASGYTPGQKMQDKGSSLGQQARPAMPQDIQLADQVIATATT